MTSRRPVEAGSKPVVRRATGRERFDCSVNGDPFSYNQRMILTEELGWAHLGCHAEMLQNRTGQLAFFTREEAQGR